MHIPATPSAPPTESRAYEARKRRLVEVLTKLYLRGAWRSMSRLLGRLHPADAAYVLQELEPGQVADLLEALTDHEHAALILSELPQAVRGRVVEGLPHRELSSVLGHLPPDDLADLIQGLPPARRERPLKALPADHREDVDALLEHHPGSAGGIMTTAFFALPDDTTAQAAIDSLRCYSDAEMVYYVFVTDEAGRLVGVTSLRQLLLADPECRLADLMNHQVIKVHTDAEEEHVSLLFDRYRLLALPVVDDDGVLAGVITVDDAIDVIGQATTEDMLRMAGTDQSELLSQSVMRVVRARLPWLAAAFVGGIGATMVIGQYEEILAQVVLLSAFVPIIIGMAGNVGVQAATVTVRGLATGSLRLTDTLALVFKELRVGFVLGCFYGAILAGFGYWMYDSLELGQVVGLTILTNMVGAAVLAVCLPMLFVRLRADPAVATGPFVTTAIDVFGVLNYFVIASLIYGL